jgi:hypothetical protein
MSSRALSLATVMLLIGCFAAIPARAENLDAGKSGSQIFAGTCAECHKSPHGLLRKVHAAALPAFLRQHYTTGGQMASVLSAYLISNGATEKRVPGDDVKPDSKPAASPEPQQAATPDAQPGRKGRNAKRLGQPGEAPDAARPDGQAPAVTERGPDGRLRAAKPKLGNRGRPGSEEPPKTDAAKTDTGKTDAPQTEAPKTDAAKDEPSKGAPAKEDRPSEAAKDEGSKPVPPSGGGKYDVEPSKVTGSGEPPALRADPVPPVTPAPAASPSPPTAVSSGSPDRPAAPPVRAEPSVPPPVTVSAPPPLVPVAPTGPPIPPISQ